MPDKESRGGPVACEPPFVEALRRLGVDVLEERYVYADAGAGPRLWTRFKRVLSTARRLRRRLQADHFDLLHLNTSFDTRALLRDVLTLLLLRSQKSAIFLKFHGSDQALLQTSNPALRLLGKILLNRLDGAGVLSSEEQQNFLRAGVREQKVFVVKNAVERTPDQPSGAFFKRMGIEPGVPVLLFIARFIPAKGLLDVILACRMVRERGQQFVLLCVGDGPERVAAEDEARRGGLETCVRFTGFIPEEETGEFYAHATALVFPTYHYEGFPMVVFYALAAGIPIITTRIRAAADYLQEPDNCLWTEPQNPEMLAQRLEYLLSRRDLRETMSRNNRILAQQFKAELVAREYLEVYQTLMRKKVMSAEC
ncbi:MAG TPA: glycosyltransferase family 4 protein [Pyrinomonadaceae bacterium]